VENKFLEIVFVFVNFNNTRFSKSVVESLLKGGLLSAPVYIVDNNSEPSERADLMGLRDSVLGLTLLLLDENIGYFPALNVGLRKARESHPNADAFVVGNNDLLFPEEFSQQLNSIAHLMLRYPVISPNIITMDGVHQNPHVISKISTFRELMYDLYHSNYVLARIIMIIARWTQAFTDRRDESFNMIPQEITQGYGACYIITQKFFANFDELWAPSFLMYEEFFLSFQLGQQGFRTFYWPHLKVKHFCHAATGKLPGKVRWSHSRRAHQLYREYVRPFHK
jgi:GT2 family glycosyltransferase